MLNRTDVRKKGFFALEKWLEKVESQWIKLKGEKGEKITATNWLNYRNKLTNQRKFKYLVLYPASGTNLFGLVVSYKEKPKISVNGLEITTEGFVIDYTSYFFETENKGEAFYLSAFLNSNVLDDLIKPLQARGLFGPRHIVKKVWEFPIPHFDSENSDHQELAKLGKEMAAKVEKFLKKKEPTKSISRLRTEVRNFLKLELEEIDKICKDILYV